MEYSIVLHVTTSATAESIMKEGFKAGTWFTTDDTYAIGLHGDRLFEVLLPKSEVEGLLIKGGVGTSLLIGRVVSPSEIISLEDRKTGKMIFEKPELRKLGEYINRPSTYYPSTEEFNRLSAELAKEQRGEPEAAMLRIQMAQLAQLYGHVAEHTGDLINRMSQEPNFFKGQYDAVYPKVKRILDILNSGYQGFMPFEKDYLGQIHTNLKYMEENPAPFWKYKGFTFDQALREIKRLGHEYAEAHRKLKPLNDAQRTAQEAAVAIGEFQFDNARRALEKLEKVLDKGPEEWAKYATMESATYSSSSAVMERQPETDEKRSTTVHDRFMIGCDECGFLVSEMKLSDALATAKRLAQKHTGKGERITVYDVMAHLGDCQIWDANGKCLEVRKFRPKLERLTDVEKQLKPVVRVFLDKYFPQFPNHPSIEVYSDEDYYKIRDFESEPLMYEGRLVETDGLYDAEINTVVYRGKPGNRELVHEIAHWAQAQRYGKEWVQNEANAQEQERDAEAVENKYATLIQWQPEIIQQFPIGELPPRIEIPPLIPTPPTKGSLDEIIYKGYRIVPTGYSVDINKNLQYTAYVLKGPKAIEKIGPYPTWAETLKLAKFRIDEIVEEEAGKARQEEISKHPIRMSLSEYNRVWKPKGWKPIFIGPTATWRSEWGVWEAIREIVQNALDETEAYEYGNDNLGFFIKDRGKGVAIKDFLLGPPKLKELWARGKYGEGMKIGGLALVRSGYPVLVETVGRQLYIIFLEQETEEEQSVETLAAIWKPGGTTQGTIWHIIGYQGDDFHDRIATNLPKSSIVASTPSLITKPKQRYNQIYNLTFPPLDLSSPYQKVGRIYARDIYLQDINSPFSYNLWSFELAPDRHAPKNEEDMWRDIGRTWAGVKDTQLLETFLKIVSEPPIIVADEGQRASLYYLGENPELKRAYSDIMQENASEWQKAWNNVHGDDFVLRTSDRWDATVKHLGYKPYSLSYYAKEGLQHVIKTDQKLIEASQDALRDVAIIPDSKLSPSQLASLKLARAITNDITHTWAPVKGVHAAIIPPASDRVRTAGLYGRQTQEIFLAAEQLDHGNSTVDTLIHEVAHHTSEKEDGEPGHYEEISKLAGIVVQKVSQRWYDKFIADPDFKW